jgi:hypothetical protein
MSRVGFDPDSSGQSDAASADLSRPRRPADQTPGSALHWQSTPATQSLDEYEEAFNKLDSDLARATLNPAVNRRRVGSTVPPAQTPVTDTPRIALRVGRPIAPLRADAELPAAGSRPARRARGADAASLGRTTELNNNLASLQEALALEQKAIRAFPSAHAEMAEGGRCFRVGRHTGCVFHMVRAAEYGLSALAHAIDARRAIESAGADWMDVIAQLEVRIAAVEGWRAEPERLTALRFFREALCDVRFLHAAAHKLAHNRSFFDAPQAATICQTTREFITRLSARVSESQKRTLSRMDFAEG